MDTPANAALTDIVKRVYKGELEPDKKHPRFANELGRDVIPGRGATPEICPKPSHLPKRF